MDKKDVVVIGGGTGTHTVLMGLKHYQDKLNLSAVVTMADSGGSTGRLRDEFGYLPVGDVRMALTALASDVDSHEELLRKLFLYRFDKGGGLAGHNFGNLLLVALTDILGSEEEAIKSASRILRVQGSVVPVTTTKVSLVATYDDGVIVKGEHLIDEPSADRGGHSIAKLSLYPEATISKSAESTILNADLVVLGPGDLYTSVLANCVVGGVSEAINNSGAKVVYICNLMTRVGQTSGMGVEKHLTEIALYLGKTPDFIIINTGTFPPDLLNKYEADGEFPVEFNNPPLGCEIIADDLLASESIQTVKGDVLKRSLIRHDSAKLADVILQIIYNPEFL